MPVELWISDIPEMSTLIYFRNDDAGVLVELAEAWIDENLAGRLPPLGPGETAAARTAAIAKVPILLAPAVADRTAAGGSGYRGRTGSRGQRAAVGGLDEHRDTQPFELMYRVGRGTS